jgi:hypothetical protein
MAVKLPQFPIESLKRTVSRVVTPSNILTAAGALGGLGIGLLTPTPGDEPFLAAAGARALPRLIGSGVGGKLLSKAVPSEAETLQSQAPTTRFTSVIQGPMSIAPGPMSTVPKGGFVSTTSGSPTSDFVSTTTPTPSTSEVSKPDITRTGGAPQLSTTPPPPTPPATGRGGGGAPLPPPTAGLKAPQLSSLPPMPTRPEELGRPALQTGQFEAMIRALQDLTGGSRFVPMPTLGAQPFGPVGALARALQRLRERELGTPVV